MPTTSSSPRHTHLTDAADVFRAVLTSSRVEGDSQGVPERSFHDLDWSALVEAIAERASGEDARELALALGLLNATCASRRVREVSELQALVNEGARVPMGAPPQLATPVLRARKVEALEAEDLLLIRESLEIASRVRRFFEHREDALPLLSEHAQRLQPHPQLAASIGRTFDPAGKIVDEASRELGRLRRRVLRLRDTIRAKLDRYLQTPRFEGILQDEYVTLRDERFVLPVRAGERGDMPGIVHGHSGSGATLFIEPEDLVPLNNDLQVAQNDVRREEYRILVGLTSEVRSVVEDIDLNGDVLTYVDLTLACAIVSDEIDSSVPTLSEISPTGEGGSLDLKRARHPVLALRARREDFEVVANDLKLDADARCLIISGPNTGGKTISLKTLGLYALMLRAGLPVPCSPDSVLPAFDQVFTDIGDEQTVEGDLSTFAAHVTNISAFVDRVQPGTLVLLDELFAGTDPAQATTLGRALLIEFERLGGWTVITTHLEGLKNLGLEDVKFASASVGFDIDRLAPTYRLRMGLPGSSYAHRIAARLGLPRRIIERAEALTDSREELETESLLRRLEDAYAAVHEEQAQAETMRRALERDQATLEREIVRARAREEKFLSEEARTLRSELAELGDLVRDQHKRLDVLRRAKDAELDAEAEQVIREARAIASSVRERTETATRAKRAAQTGGVQAADLRKGDRVHVRTFNQSGFVAEEPRAGAKVSVQMGAVRVQVRVADLSLRGRAEDDASPARSGARVARNDRGGRLERSLDLRGERVDDALEKLDAFIEDAVANELSSVVVIHGHGTGALKRAVRAHLSQIAYELRSRPGARSEGGDGVTILEFFEQAPNDTSS